jgi:hybrid cluster-associated redox disulfide protein
MTRYAPDMLISDVLASDPHAARVFTSLGLGCPSCLGAGMETLDSVASMHDVPLETLLQALDSIESTPSSPEETP